MTPCDSSTLSALTVCYFRFWIWKNFSGGPTFGPFWSIKYLNLGQKLPIRTAHHIFLESRHPEVTKNLYYVLSTCWSQILIFLGSRSWTKLSRSIFKIFQSNPQLNFPRYLPLKWRNQMRCNSAYHSGALTVTLLKSASI